jgi:hypothetical protein
MIIFVIALIVVAIFLFKGGDNGVKKVINVKTFKGQIINDTIKIPNTVQISSNEGEIVPRGEYNIKLQPRFESEQVFISKAKLTLKEAYGLATVDAYKWAGDEKLVFIKSNGALGLDGRSSSWQLVYGSNEKNRNYEIIISEDKIVSAKELNSAVSGFDLPQNWYDSYEAIISLGALPQFKEETVSAISFYYSEAESSWAYGLANGDKTTAMWVK